MGEAEQGRSILPPLDVVQTLDVMERNALVARALAAAKRKRQMALEAAIGLPDIADWIEAHCYDADKVRNPEFPAGAPKIVLEGFQRRILRHCFTIDPRTGRFPYTTVVYSAPKKSGKSAIGGCVTGYFAACVELPNSVYVLANDREQSSGRVYKAAKPTLYGLGGRKEGKYLLHLPNGSVVQASTSNPDKEAGGTYGLTVWDELWAYTTERAKLLWDELRPVPTRQNSMRLVVTYAGFEDSSDLLYKLYNLVFTDSSETELQPGARAVPGLEDITTFDAKGNVIPACYEVPEAGLFYFNDHEQRMRWQVGEAGERLIREITATESKETNTYRLTHNRWQKTEDRFISDDELKMSFRRFGPRFLNGVEFSSGAPDTIPVAVSPVPIRPMTLGVDAGWMKDCSAIVGSNREKDQYVTAYARTWRPEKKEGGLDLKATIYQTILELIRAGRVARRKPMEGEKSIVLAERLVCYDIWYDPTQLHQLMMDLRKEHRILCAPFDQKRKRILSDTFLRTQYQMFRIDNLPDKELESHLDAAKGLLQPDFNKDDEEYVRIVKGQGDLAKPIDLAVAQSMSVYACSLRPTIPTYGGIAQGKAKGWTKK